MELPKKSARKKVLYPFLLPPTLLPSPSLCLCFQSQQPDPFGLPLRVGGSGGWEAVPVPGCSGTGTSWAAPALPPLEQPLPCAPGMAWWKDCHRYRVMVLMGQMEAKHPLAWAQKLSPAAVFTCSCDGLQRTLCGEQFSFQSCSTVGVGTVCARIGASWSKSGEALSDPWRPWP